MSSVLSSVTNGVATNFGIHFNGGTLQYASGNTQDVSSAMGPISAAQAASIDTNGNTVTLGAGLSAAGGGLFVGNGGASGAFSGTIQNFSGAAALYKTGSGMLTLSGNNTYAGGTTVSGGILQLGGNVNILDRQSLKPGDVVDNQSVQPSERRLKASQVYRFVEPEKPVDSPNFILNNGVLVYSGSSDAAWSLSGASWSLSGGTVAYIDGKPIDLKLREGTPQKLVESWKPARVIPNRSRLMVGEKEELPLKGMQVDVRVDGFRARVLIDMYYYNDRQQQLEGNFQLRLPDEASPYFFAFGRTVYQAPQVTAADSMFFKPQQVSLGDTTPEKILQLRGNSWEQPKVARMVPKEKAAVAYRDTVRRRVDPGLVEWSGAGVFQCRVFPLAPHSLHRVTVGYDVDLVRVGDDLELRLDLPAETPATIVDLNIAAADARQVSLDAPATLTPGPSPGGRGESAAPATLAPGLSPSGRGELSRLSYRLVDPQQSPLAVRLRKPGTLMLTGADEATGNYFATRVGLTLPETPSADRAKQAIFLVDTSLSAGPQFPLWTKLLRATLDNNRDSIQEFAVVFFNVETFWWQEKFVANTPENVDALLDYADGLALEGATDLGRALKEAAAPSWLKRGYGLAPDLFCSATAELPGVKTAGRCWRRR